MSIVDIRNAVECWRKNNGMLRNDLPTDLGRSTFTQQHSYRNILLYFS